MTDPGFDKLPDIIQWGLTAATVIGGTIAFLFGRNNRPTNTEEVTLRELDRLQQEALINLLRRDLEEVLRANREAHEVKLGVVEKESREGIKEIYDEMRHDFNELSERVRGIEIEMAGLKARPIRR